MSLSEVFLRASASPREQIRTKTVDHSSRGAAESAEESTLKELDEITGAIIDASLRIHRDLGPGLLEAVYETVLARSLEKRGLYVERQKVVRFTYDGMIFEEGFRVDLLVEGRVIAELKSVENLAPVHGKQVLTYLKLMRLPVALLINFGASTLKEGLHRIVNHLDHSASPCLRVNQSVAKLDQGSRGGAENAE